MHSVVLVSDNGSRAPAPPLGQPHQPATHTRRLACPCHALPLNNSTPAGCLESTQSAVRMGGPLIDQACQVSLDLKFRQHLGGGACTPASAPTPAGRPPDQPQPTPLLLPAPTKPQAQVLQGAALPRPGLGGEPCRRPWHPSHRCSLPPSPSHSVVLGCSQVLPGQQVVLWGGEEQHAVGGLHKQQRRPHRNNIG